MYLDLYKLARTNGEFRHKLEQLIIRYTEFLKKAEQGSIENLAKANETLEAIFKYCNYNSFFVVGYYFPNYPRDKPLSFVDYPFVASMLNFQVGGFTVLRGSRQIAKSTGLSVRQILNAHMIPGLRSLYIAPRGDQVATYANKLRETERACRLYKADYRLRQNLKYKEFPNRATIELAHVLTDAGNVRGKSTDELLYDEYQEFDPELETEVQQCQAASPHPVTIYSGTSLTTETALEAKFSVSSQGYWSIKCGCGNWNIPLPEYNVLDMIQKDGPTCVKCQKLLNVYHGEFIHAQPQMIEKKQIGLHIPQIIVPAVVNNAARWEAIYNLKLTTTNIKKFYQELLGIPTEEGVREITRKHLEEMCSLGPIAKLQQRAMTKGYQYVVSGCDWGGTDPSIEHKLRISTTVHAMMGIRAGTKKFEIIHMRRYEGMDYDSIAADICMNHVKFKGHALASDTGVGAAYNSLIRKYLPPSRHLLFTYSPPNAPYFAEPETSHTYNEWRLNKTESITELFNAVRARRIECYDWDHASPELLDFLNIFRTLADTAGGNTTFRWIASATKPNDTLQACNYAYTLGRLLLGEDLVADRSLRIKLDQSLKGTLEDFIMKMPGAISG